MKISDQEIYRFLYHHYSVGCILQINQLVNMILHLDSIRT